MAAAGVAFIALIGFCSAAAAGDRSTGSGRSAARSRSSWCAVPTRTIATCCSSGSRLGAGRAVLRGVARSGPSRACVLPRAAGIAAVALLFIHVVAAPVLLPVRCGSRARSAAASSASMVACRGCRARRPGLVLVPYRSSTCATSRASCGARTAVSRRALAMPAVASDDIAVAAPGRAHARADARTWVPALLRGHERARAQRAVCRRRSGRATRVAIEIVAITADGRPATARFTSRCRSTTRRCAWSMWRHGGYRPFTPPASGRHRHYRARPTALATSWRRSRNDRAPPRASVPPESHCSRCSPCIRCCGRKAAGHCSRRATSRQRDRARPDRRRYRIVAIAFLFQLCVGCRRS